MGDRKPSAARDIETEIGQILGSWNYTWSFNGGTLNIEAGSLNCSGARDLGDRLLEVAEALRAHEDEVGRNNRGEA